MPQLIDRTDFAANYRKITDSNYNSGTLEQHIQDAQMVDVQFLMGRDFFNDMIRNYTDAKYTALLNAGDYNYQGAVYTNYGLKSVITLYAYSRYIVAGSQTDTPFGYVEKNATDSTRVDLDRKKSMGKSNEQAGFSNWENVRDFLNRNSTTYPLWKSECVSSRGNFRITKIG
jgi:hypothetical protein